MWLTPGLVRVEGAPGKDPWCRRPVWCTSTVVMAWPDPAAHRSWLPAPQLLLLSLLPTWPLPFPAAHRYGSHSAAVTLSLLPTWPLPLLPSACTSLFPQCLQPVLLWIPQLLARGGFPAAAAQLSSPCPMGLLSGLLRVGPAALALEALQGPSGH